MRISSYSLIILICLTSFDSHAQNQGVNNNWVLGYGAYWGPPYGHSIMDFNTGSLVVNSDSLEMDLNRCAANISDTAGNILFYTNGYYIADASHDTMDNGNNISPTGWATLQPEGLNVPQACLIIPVADSAGQYYLFHSTLDNAPTYNKAYYLYLSKIDINLNGGLGGVVSKNNIILQDTLNPGKITGCKNANGKDWWIICQKANSNIYFIFLINSAGVLGPYLQNIGSPRTSDYGMAGFSPDGKKYASFHAEYMYSGGLDIFDFDRCSGLLSNPVHIVIPQTTGFSGGMAFSPNSRYLYAANIENIYQFDMDAANIPASQITVATWDGYYSPSPPFGTYFDLMQLAPDGKIYISTGNSTFHLHVINNPDSASLACDVQQHVLQIQNFYTNALPNHPNYFLGCDTTSSCSCLTSSNEELMQILKVTAFPNPSSGIITVSFPIQTETGELYLYDINGKLLGNAYIAPWSQFKQFDLTKYHPGIYFVKLEWKTRNATFKIIRD